MSTDGRREGGWTDLLAEILDTDPSPRDWVDQAICSQTDPEIFFPRPGGTTAEAKLVCRRCPVRAACKQWAADAAQPYGVWGGDLAKDTRTLVATDDDLPAAG